MRDAASGSTTAAKNSGTRPMPTTSSTAVAGNEARNQPQWPSSPISLRNSRSLRMDGLELRRRIGKIDALLLGDQRAVHDARVDRRDVLAEQADEEQLHRREEEQ